MSYNMYSSPSSSPPTSSSSPPFSPDSPYDLTNKDYQHALIAAKAAEHSTMASKHGCVATCGNGKVLATATNCIRSCSKEGFLDDQCSCHAEIHALRKLYYSHVQSSFQSHRTRYCVLQFQKNEGFL